MPSRATRFDTEAVKRLRTSKGLSQEEFGRRMGYTRAMVSLVERGDANPSVAYLERMAATFAHVDLRWLWCDGPVSKK